MIQRWMTMLDNDTRYLERLGTQCGAIRLEKVLRHDNVRSIYQGLNADQQFCEVHIFEESFYQAESVHSSIATYIEGLQQTAPESTQPVISYGSTSYDEPYLVFARSSGDQLSHILQHRKIVSIEECLRLGISASQTLDAMHKKGLFHGCLTPRCIWIDDDRVILSDLGIGYIASLGNKLPAGAVGVPLYMSLEQLRGEAACAESDTYALALILYECITGLPPQASATVNELALQRHASPSSLAAATDTRQPSEIEVFFRKALSKKRSERYPDAQELNEALLSVQRRRPVALEIPSRKIPHRYRILRHESAASLSEMQRIDTVALERTILTNKKRDQIVLTSFALCAAAAVALYAMTLGCLASMQQQVGAIRTSLAEPSSVGTAAGANNFAINPPVLSKGELTGSTKLDSVMKFCTGYGLRADGCIGNFRKISTLSKLEFLSVSNTNITDGDIIALSDLPLKSVDIRNCPRLTRKAFLALQKIPTLRFLHAESLELSPDDLRELNHQLVGLTLKSCHLDNRCVQLISNVKSLARLELQDNQITAASLKYLKMLPNLYYVDLQNNAGIRKKDVDELATALPNTVVRFHHSRDERELDLSGSSSNNSTFRGFGKLQLRYVGINNCRVPLGVLKELQEMPHLVVLDASGSSLHDDDLAYLNPNLRSLDLASCHISDKGVEHLSHLKNLVFINFNDCGLTPASFEVLRKLKNLRLVDFRDCSNISTEQAKAFEDSLPDTVVNLNRIRR